MPESTAISSSVPNTHLSPVPATPTPGHSPMSLSRSPSPRPGGGWSTPGLTTGSSRGSSPGRTFGEGMGVGVGVGYYGGMGMNGGLGVPWGAFKEKSGYPSFSTRNTGFFSRHRRKLSARLPRFTINAAGGHAAGGHAAGSSGPGPGFGEGTLLRKVLTLVGNLLRRTRIRLLLVLLLGYIFWLVFRDPIMESYRASSWGSGSQVVLIVPSNIGGGVMELKGAREWAIERHSLGNKRRYAKKWGYHLESPNMVTKKRYSHEWREGWEKVDALRQAMRKYSNAEWFWWLDLTSFIMEPSISIHSHLLDHLSSTTYRDINIYNPLNITHPPDLPYLDPLSLSPTGDNHPSSINLIIPQDCSGFALGSFLVRRSAWTDRLLDLWWDPVAYEQRHMIWDNKEQNALERLYATQPWIRPHVAFAWNRRINAFPPGACGDDGTDERFHYQQGERDFLVNMAGCGWGRDCWTEMYTYWKMSEWLNRNPWEKLRDGVRGLFKRDEKS